MIEDVEKPSDKTKLIRVSVFVRRNPNPPAAAVASVEAIRAQPPGHRRPVTDAEFNAVYGANPADLDQVAKWPEENHLKVIDRSISKHRLLLEGTIGDFEKAFEIQLTSSSTPSAETSAVGRESSTCRPISPA